jgi:hypothetical protein
MTGSLFSLVQVMEHICLIKCCQGFVIPRKMFHKNVFPLIAICVAAAADPGFVLFFCIKLKESLKMAFAENHGTIIFDQILSSIGLAHIGENIFEQLDGESLENCELVCESWRQFISNNGVKLWKRQYLHKLAKPGTDAHRLIKSNPNLFQFDSQADQGTFHTLKTNL